MKSKLLATVGLLMITVLLATSQVSAITNVVTPEFEDHDISGAVVELSTEQTVIGVHSVKMSIPQGEIGEVYNLGLNAEVRLATGMSRSRGLVLYDGVSFKAKPGAEGVNGPLYVSLILYDRTDRVWVSILNYAPEWSGPDGDGWCTVTVPAGSPWDGWTFLGDHYGPGYVSLTVWDEWIKSEGIDVDVRKVNIQFGYGWYAWGTVYVDVLSFAGRTLDFEP